MFGLATLKAKLIAAAVLVALMGLLGGYVWHLKHQVSDLQTAKIELTHQVKEKDATIAETARREDVVDAVTTEGNKERIIIEKHYQTKINKVDNDVKEGKDRAVGPLLNEYFNSGL